VSGVEPWLKLVPAHGGRDGADEDICRSHLMIEGYSVW